MTKVHYSVSFACAPSLSVCQFGVFFVCFLLIHMVFVSFAGRFVRLISSPLVRSVRPPVRSFVPSFRSFVPFIQYIVLSFDGSSVAFIPRSFVRSFVHSLIFLSVQSVRSLCLCHNFSYDSH